MSEHSPSRRGFLISAIAAGAVGKAAYGAPVRIVEQTKREFEMEGWPATEFTVKVDQIGSLGEGAGPAVEFLDPVSKESFLAPLFDLSILTEAKFQENLKASVQAHGDWHDEQGRTAPAIHIHLVRVADHPNLRALLVHPRQCSLGEARRDANI